MAHPRKIVVVCSGNTCRSAMGEALLRRALVEELGPGAEEIRVVSAGILANEGDPASANAIAAMRELGMDITSHRARGLSAEVLEGAELVLTMTSAHKRAVLAQHPWLEGRVMTANEFADLAAELGPDTPDPFGGSIEAYRATARDLARAMERAAKRIIRASASEKDRAGSEEFGPRE